MTASADRYTGGANAYHWLMAALVIFLLVQGYAIDLGPNATKAWWVNLHSAVGVVVTLLLLGRIVWRVGHRPPDLPDGTSALIRISSHAAHMLLYFLMIVVCISGFVNIFARGRGIDFGVFQFPPIMASDRSITRPADVSHLWLAYALGALAVLHIAAAVWHQWIVKDRLMLRMMPGGN